MSNKLPNDVMYELRYELGRLDIHEYHNVNGYKKGDVSAEKVFSKRRDTKKPWFETSVLMKNGEKWYVGCNYGR